MAYHPYKFDPACYIPGQTRSYVHNVLSKCVWKRQQRLIIDVDNNKKLRTVSKNSLVVQASFYGDIVVFASDVEGRGFDPQPGQMVYRIFHMSVTFILTGGLRQNALNSQRTRLIYCEIICPSTNQHQPWSTTIFCFWNCSRVRYTAHL